MFNQNSNTSTGSNKKRSAKGAPNNGNSAVALAKGAGGNAPTAGDFMPSSATSATAFYAASKQAAQQSQQKFSNYQLQNLNKQKQHQQ